jgi:hypothetical protein
VKLTGLRHRRDYKFSIETLIDGSRAFSATHRSRHSSITRCEVQKDSARFESPPTRHHAEATEYILKTSGAAGYLPRPGQSAHGRLAWELAKQSQLKVITRSQPNGSLQLRLALLPSGVYGTRIEVLHLPAA